MYSVSLMYFLFLNSAAWFCHPHESVYMRGSWTDFDLLYKCCLHQLFSGMQIDIHEILRIYFTKTIYLILLYLFPLCQELQIFILCGRCEASSTKMGNVLTNGLTRESQKWSMNWFGMDQPLPIRRKRMVYLNENCVPVLLSLASWKCIKCSHSLCKLIA